MTQVTADHVAQFNDRGFVVFDNIITPQQVAAVTGAIERVGKGRFTQDMRPPAHRKPVNHFGKGSSIRWYLNSRLLDADLWKVTTDQRLGEMAARLLDTPSVSLVEDQLLDKPGPGLPCNFHQDYGYWAFSKSTKMLTCWIALVDMVAEMGPLQLFPGSHVWGSRPNPKELIVGSEQSLFEAADAARPAGPRPDTVTVTVPAGGGVFFHSLTFHGSAANTTNKVRRAFSLHWAAEECRVDLSKLMQYTYPYAFFGIPDDGRVVNKFMPKVYPTFSVKA